MAKWLKNIFSKGTGEAVAKIGDVVAKIGAGHLGKKEAMLAIEEILDRKDARDHEQATAELKVKEGVLVAELNQDDLYTKRTRPYVIRHGFHLIAARVILQAVSALFDMEIPVSELEIWFVGSWAGLTGVYKIGRSAEKSFKAANGKVPKPVSLITGGD